MAMISQKIIVIMLPGNMQRLLAHIAENVKIKFDGFVKSPDAALRFILCHCGVRIVRLIPQAPGAHNGDLLKQGDEALLKKDESLPVCAVRQAHCAPCLRIFLRSRPL
jgi:hypothetical protein